MYSRMKSSTWSVSPVSPDASATVTLLRQCEKENTSPSIPMVKSFAISAVDTALLEALSFSLQKKKENSLTNDDWLCAGRYSYI